MTLPPPDQGAFQQMDGGRTGMYMMDGSQTGVYPPTGGRTGVYSAEGGKTGLYQANGGQTGVYAPGGGRTGLYIGEGGRTGLYMGGGGGRTGLYRPDGGRTGVYSGNATGMYTKTPNPYLARTPYQNATLGKTPNPYTSGATSQWQANGARTPASTSGATPNPYAAANLQARTPHYQPKGNRTPAPHISTKTPHGAGSSGIDSSWAAAPSVDDVATPSTSSQWNDHRDGSRAPDNDLSFGVGPVVPSFNEVLPPAQTPQSSSSGRPASQNPHDSSSTPSAWANTPLVSSQFGRTPATSGGSAATTKKGEAAFELAYIFG